MSAQMLWTTERPIIASNVKEMLKKCFGRSSSVIKKFCFTSTQDIKG